MVWFKRSLWTLCIVIAVIAIAVTILINPFGPSPLNDYQTDGRIVVDGLSAPVRIVRDEKGMAYIYANNLDDLTMAQGYVTATDRLFQMELTKLISAGRIGELAGPAARSIDVTMRTLGFRRQALKHLAILNAETRRFLQQYADGVNAFIRLRPGDIPIEFKLAGIEAEPWEPVDTLCILYFMGWNSAANLQHEIVSQMLAEKLGLQKTQQLAPVNINPAASPGSDEADRTEQTFTTLKARLMQRIFPFLPNRSWSLGSNNWTVNGRHTASGKPILANDPHLDASMLPGPWYSTGLITPDIRAVGASIPGLPGMVIGRTRGMAMGVTNAYGDAQDLYVETVDPANPDHYLEGQVSVPFEVVHETLNFKDKTAADGQRSEEVAIRLTRRGPVVTDLLEGLKTDKVMTVRWAAFEKMHSSIALERTLACRAIAEFRDTLRDANYIALNWVFADENGDIGWHVSGPLPIRDDGDGRLPHPVSSEEDNWKGWIPFEQMPNAANPPKGWLSTANHKSVGRDYPYYYSNYFSTSFRQRRLQQLLDDEDPKTPQQHWQYQRDVFNLKAKELAPVMAAVLMKHADTQDIGRILQAWNTQDTCDQPGPTLFHSIFNELAFLTYRDELGDELVRTMLNDGYFWEERLLLMIREGVSSWFDDVSTASQTETMDDMLHQAALQVSARLSATYGSNPSDWLWGKIHRYDFYSPIARRGLAKKLLGGGNYPAAGSGDTLCRSLSNWSDLSKVDAMASLRMVIDLGDPDKIMAVLPGGITARVLHPHTTDQIASYINGDPVYWWYSDDQIASHRQHEFILDTGKTGARKGQN